VKGKILNYEVTTKSGVISGDDGKRYTFTSSDWKSTVVPKAGSKIDFAAHEGAAKDIYTDSISIGPGAKRLTAALLAFFLGGFGAHKFYLGYKAQGIIMLLVFWFGFILLGIPTGVIALISFIEFILYLSKSDEEFEQIYVIGRKPWF